MYLVFVLIDALVFLLIDQLGFILKTTRTKAIVSA